MEYRRPHFQGGAVGRLDNELGTSEAVLSVCNVVSRNEDGGVCDGDSDCLFGLFPERRGGEKGS